MDTVIIEDLAIEAVIGIFPWERKARQLIHISLEMAHPNHSAANSGHIEDALNYKTVVDCVSAFVVEQQFELLETLVEQVAELVQREFSVRWLSIECYKPTVLAQVKRVGVKIERGDKKLAMVEQEVPARG